MNTCSTDAFLTKKVFIYFGRTALHDRRTPGSRLKRQGQTATSLQLCLPIKSPMPSHPTTKPCRTGQAFHLEHLLPFVKLSGQRIYKIPRPIGTVVATRPIYIHTLLRELQQLPCHLHRGVQSL